MASSPIVQKKSAKTSGLGYWMRQVLEQCDRVASDFDADAVHDLRVALRRCRSMADGLRAIDPNPQWQKMKKSGRELFQRLGSLRDTQVMLEWIDELESKPSKSQRPDDQAVAAIDAIENASSQTPPAVEELAAAAQSSMQVAAQGSQQLSQDSVADSFRKILFEREKEQKREARAALEKFDQKRWNQWAKTLPARASHVRPGSGVFKHLALERWMEARQLHATALRNRSQVALHTLRIGIKRFRYIVENFLPAEHKAWSKDLKDIQDALGEIHDLDVFWATALACRVFPDAISRNRWHARILAERNRRIAHYRERMVGPNSWWEQWRAGLPQGRQIQALAMRRIKLWAATLDPDFVHSEHVAALALDLYDGLTRAGYFSSSQSDNLHAAARLTLQIAALTHDVGKSEGDQGHHKASMHLIQSHGAPPGLNLAEMRRAAVIARFHCKGLPTRSHKALRDFLPEEQEETIQLAAILRLANAFDTGHAGQIRRVLVENQSSERGRSDCVVLQAEGYSARSDLARNVAAERYLLETVLRKAIIIKPMKAAGTKTSQPKATLYSFSSGKPAA